MLITLADNILTKKSEGEALPNETGMFMGKTLQHTVVEVGVSVESVKVGDIVYFDSRAGLTVLASGNEYVTIRERDVICLERENA